MSNVNVKLPDGLERDMNEYIDETGHHMNASELVRDALREYLEERQANLSAETLERIEQSKRELARGEGLTIEEVREDLGLNEK